MNCDIRITSTPDEVANVANCFDHATGLVSFLSNFYYAADIGSTVAERFSLSEAQLQLLVEVHQSQYSVCALPPLADISTTMVGYLLWQAMFMPGRAIVITTPTRLDAQDFMQRVQIAYFDCPEFMRADLIGRTKSSITFGNGSRIITTKLSETAMRGMKIDILYIDQLASVNTHAAVEMWHSMMPALRNDGKVIVTSEPLGEKDIFATLWKNGIDAGTPTRSQFKRIRYIRGEDELAQRMFFHASVDLGLNSSLLLRIENGDAGN